MKTILMTMLAAMTFASSAALADLASDPNFPGSPAYNANADAKKESECPNRRAGKTNDIQFSMNGTHRPLTAKPTQAQTGTAEF